jgi:hypothetical protein
MTQATQIAQRFAADLKAALTPDEFAEVLKRNTAETVPGICHSHDFVDANMVMQPAWEAVVGRPMVMDESDQAEADRRLWNEAWDHATRNYLNDAVKKVWVDKGGHRVSISELGVDEVLFYTAGGGFQCRMPRAKFFDTFREMTEPPAFRPGFVDADWMEDGERHPCWTKGDLWNGWGMPFFERAVVDKLIEQSSGEGLSPMRWDGDVVVIIDTQEDPENAEVRVAPTIMPNGEPAWDIGAGWWCWNQVQFEKPRQVHFHSFELQCRIDDPERLLAAALAHEDSPGEDDLRDADGNVDIRKCLVILLDPGTLPGGEILGSSSNWETSHDA